MRILIGITMLLLLLPKVGLQCLLAWYHQKKIALHVQMFAGKDMQCIEHRTVTVSNASLKDFDTWFLYLKGKYDLIGPAPISFDSACNLNRNKRSRLQVSPGIISPFQVKKMSGIAHQDENQLAIDFANNATRARRVQIFLIWLFQSFFSTKTRHLHSPRNFKLLGVTLTNITMKDAVDRIINSVDRIPTLGGATKFAFVNADCVNKYHEDSVYKQTLNQFDTVFADGIGVRIAARWQNIAIKENVNGTDMLPFLCKKLSAKNKSIYLLGASETVVSKVAAKLNNEYPQLTVAGFKHGFIDQTKPQEILNDINQSGADLLLVAMGAPRQELWIADNTDQLKLNAVMGVGGLFDFYSGQVSRAPIWLRELSLEWVWRLGVQPIDKAKRYLFGNPLFLFRAALACRTKKLKKIVVHSSNQELNHDTF